MKIDTSVAYRIYDLRKNKKAILFHIYSRNYMFLEGLSAELFEILLLDNEAILKKWLTENEITESDIGEFKNELAKFGCFEESPVKNTVKDISNNKEDEKYNAILTDFIEELHENGLYYDFHIDLTYRCNEKCIHCYHPFEKYDLTNEMSTQEVKELIDLIYDMGVFHIVLSGGEALLRKDVFEIIEYISLKGMMVTLFSNGMLLTEDIILKIKQYRVRLISISLYSDVAVNHDSITTVKGSFDKTMEGIKLLKKYEMPFELKCVMLAENIDRLESIQSYFAQFTNGKTCKIDFSLCGRLDGSCEVFQHMVSEEKVRKAFYTNPERYIGTRESLRRSPEQSPCNAGKYGLYCSPEGNIYPCVSFKLFLCHYKELLNISQNEILKKWRSVKIKDFSECFKHSYCSYCTEQCAGENLIENGDYLDSNVSYCAHAKIIEDWFAEHNSSI